MSLFVINEDELRQTVTIPEAIAAVEAAFVALAENRLHVPGHFSLDLPQVNGKIEMEGAYLTQSPYYVVRMSSFFPANLALKLPLQNGLSTIFDTATGQPVAIIVDNGYLTHLRAGAAGALAARYLANHKLDQVVVIGSGNQAYMQLKSLMAVRSVGLVSVLGSPQKTVPPAEANCLIPALLMQHFNLSLSSSKIVTIL